MYQMFIFILIIAPTVYSCNYEQKTLCQWVQDGTDNFNWTVQQGHTSSSGTGPSADHTIKNSKCFSLVSCR